MKASKLAIVISICLSQETQCFSQTKPFQSSKKSSERRASIDDFAPVEPESSTRRKLIHQGLLSLPALVLGPHDSNAGTFTPGGTLVDRDVGVTVGNSEASTSRKVDNSNVLFSQDNYFKFGVAAPWIEADSTEFPKTMPFVLSQQRYDSLKKYGERVKAGAQAVPTFNLAVVF